VFVYLCNLNELAPWQIARGLYQGGVPWLVPIIVILGVILTFVLSKTRYGRHIYAVGGNTEAARRAGIPVRLVRTSVFSICSALAAVSGLFAASQQNAATDNQGQGNVLLLGVAAAVVGGTSLAGGRGRVVDAILGGLALSILAFGMSDLLNSGNNTQYEDIITGVVLLIAAGVDATSRHAGRASS
jgi:D-xylose transport system permease protein